MEYVGKRKGKKDRESEKLLYATLFIHICTVCCIIKSENKGECNDRKKYGFMYIHFAVELM